MASILAKLAVLAGFALAGAASSRQYEVRIKPSEGHGLRKCHSARSSELLTDSKGQQYRCCTDNTQNAPVGADQSLSKTRGAAIVRETRLLRARHRLDALLEAPLRSMIPGSFWTYEISLKEGVKQFRPAVPGSNSEGPVFSLGMPPSLLNTQADDEHTEETDAEKHREGHDSELVADEYGSLLLRSHFVGGTDGRRAFVDTRCAPAGRSRDSSEAAVPLTIASIQEDVPSRQYLITVEAHDRVLCDLLPSIDRLLMHVNGSTLQHSAGWWSYSFTLGEELKQYHATPLNNGQVMTAAGAPANGQRRSGGKQQQDDSKQQSNVLIEQESILGVYDWEHGDVLETDAVGEPPAIVQRYTQGTMCPLTGKPRETVVRIECLPITLKNGVVTTSSSDEEDESGSTASTTATATTQEIAWGLKSISEPSTCNYKVVIALSEVCRHPALGPRNGVAAINLNMGGASNTGNSNAAATLSSLLQGLKVPAGANGPILNALLSAVGAAAGSADGSSGSASGGRGGEEEPTSIYCEPIAEEIEGEAGLVTAPAAPAPVEPVPSSPSPAVEATTAPKQTEEGA
jgi:Glucosidase II beta subunit-like protein